ncbi:MAG: hypothetical protein OSJ70_03195 [Bacilli bacterium]|nr:hypothetical protein [Bacilli bacterium]
MTEEFNELYNMLSTDREDVKNIKANSEKDISMLLGRVRSYIVDDINMESDYNLDTDYERYKVDNIFLNYNVRKDITEYKITLLQSYLQDLFIEKKFNEYRKQKEEALSKTEYLEYMHNTTVRSDRIAAWYQEFMQR